jgi:hypothetical protein
VPIVALLEGDDCLTLSEIARLVESGVLLPEVDGG